MGTLATSNEDRPSDDLRNNQGLSAYPGQETVTDADLRSTGSHSDQSHVTSDIADQTFPVRSQSISSAISLQPLGSPILDSRGLIVRPSWPRNTSGTYLPTAQPLTSEPGSYRDGR